MEEFVSEHGGVLMSIIVSVILIAAIFMIVSVVGNMEAYTITSIAGE